MKVKTSDLIDKPLDYAVAKALGGTNFRYDTVATYWITLDGKDRALSKGWAQSFTPSTDWAQGGPIIERENIATLKGKDYWAACVSGTEDWIYTTVFDEMIGPAPLVAAMRCFVASKLGDEVDIPEELS